MPSPAVPPRGLPGLPGPRGRPAASRSGAGRAASAAASASRRRQVAASTPVPAERGTTASERAGAVVPPSRMRPARTRISSRPPAGARLIHRSTCSPRMTIPRTAPGTRCAPATTPPPTPVRCLSVVCPPSVPPPRVESNKHRTLLAGADPGASGPAPRRPGPYRPAAPSGRSRPVAPRSTTSTWLASRIWWARPGRRTSLTYPMLACTVPTSCRRRCGRGREPGSLNARGIRRRNPAPSARAGPRAERPTSASAPLPHRGRGRSARWRSRA